MVIERDNFGFVLLDNLNIKQKAKINRYTFSFIYKKRKYFFKELKSVDQCYNELIGHELAKDFGFKSVCYDMASFDGFCGYVSKDYMKEGYVLLEDILVKKYGDIRDRNNVNDAVIALSDLYPEDVVDRLRNDLIRLLMFDIIIGNYDRHEGNIIIDTREGRLGIVPDNEMLLDEDSIYSQYFCFKMFSGERFTLNSLLAYLDMEGLNEFLSKIEIISDENIASVFERVEARIDTEMVSSLKKKLATRFSDYHRTLVNAVKNEILYRKQLEKK